MKLTHFKIVPFILAGTALLALSGCDGTTGISSDSGLGGTPAPLTEAQCLLAAGGYGTIVINGRTWLDRNLGASEVAFGTNDSLAYGDFYQWGRSADGHQERTSDTNDTLATTLDASDVNTDWYGKFIVGTVYPRDWVENTVDDDGSLRSQSWSTPYDETTNPNQVCPCGYVVPTTQDFIDLNITASNTTDTFKLAYGGWRWFDDQRGIEGETINTFFWTSDPNPNNVRGSVSYFFSNSNEGIGRDERGFGLSIRCIKPQ